MSETIQLPQGSTFARTYSSFKDEFGVAASSLASWTFTGAIKRCVTDADVDALIKLANTDFVRAGTSVGFTLSPSAMAVLSIEHPFFFAIKAQSPSGFVGTLDEARIIISRSAKQTI